VRFFVKVPGYDFNTDAKTLKFKYADSTFSDDIPNDYERLIRDAFVGDQTLFASTNEIMASWKYMMPILNNLKNIPLKLYEKGVTDVE
jgi:glucose-6-phosphate 1-dehydrogenase